MSHPVASRQREREFRRAFTTAPAAAAGGAQGGTPSENGKPPRAEPAKRKKYLREYVRWLWPYRWRLAFVFALAVAAAGLDLIWPLAIKSVIDLLSSDVPREVKEARLNLLAGVVGSSTAGIVYHNFHKAHRRCRITQTEAIAGRAG